VHGRPTRRNYKTLKEEASALASKVEDITYAWSKNAMDDYGLLANILGANEYNKLTNINSYAISLKPALYDPTITTNTCSPTSVNRRKKNGNSSAPPGLFKRGSSEALSTIYVTLLTNNIIPNSNIASRHIATSLHSKSWSI
jgi:hypothetical protein